MAKRLIFPVALGLALLSAPASAGETCTDDETVCLTTAKGAKWRAGAKSSRKDRKRRGRGSAGTVTLNIENGRGSVFLNGRYAGTAPTEFEVPAGRNDVQVRDGMIVLAEGLLSMPKGGSLEMTVQHP